MNIEGTAQTETVVVSHWYEATRLAEEQNIEL